MKFVYGYRDKSNERHEGVVCAKSRDDAFAKLRTQGLKPYYVELAPGFVNRLLAFGFRRYAILILAVVAGCAIYISVSLSKTIEAVEQSNGAPHPRHQIYGDPALMDELERTNYATVFSHPGERVLARYAQPGAYVRPDNLDCSVFSGCLTNVIVVSSDDSREVRELKQIVMWMKIELARYLENGKSTPERYYRRLRERQIREAQLYRNAKKELESETDATKFDSVNLSLRKIGLPTVARPVSEGGLDGI